MKCSWVVTGNETLKSRWLSISQAASAEFFGSTGAEKFRSGVLHEGMAGKAINVDLGGATEFVIQGDETADGIGWDHRC
jgi:hypothetical protein